VSDYFGICVYCGSTIDSAEDMAIYEGEEMHEWCADNEVGYDDEA
jgi:hypothetical protein